MSFRVLQPGVLSLIQDRGRFGHHRIGLTTGGPVDPEAFQLCNRLLGNRPDSSCVEVSFGGLQLQCRVDTFICVTGAALPLLVNGGSRPLWEVHRVTAGATIELGFAERGCRAYLGVAEGFAVEPSFDSTATVPREHIGGLRGEPLQAGDELPCRSVHTRARRFIPPELCPRYQDRVTVRVIPGYQQASFSRLQQRRFFSHAYTVSDRSDRMGYRLEGPAIRCDIDGILSEGICFGAVQVPADGQPIVLLNDRQTIGGYPKIGAALSLDAARLAQLTPGGLVHFAPITPFEAHNALHLAHRYLGHRPLMERDA